MVDLPKPGDFSRELISLATQMLPGDAQARLAALVSARTARTDADVPDQILLAHYLLTGSGEPPTVEEVHRIEVQAPSGRTWGTSEPLYPREEGDILILGPEIFTNTKGGPAENSVITWKGEQFVPHRDAGPPLEELAMAEPAPTEGEGWKGRAP